MTATLNLSAFPRVRLLEGATPIQHLPRLSHALGGAQIYVKRDDLTGLGCGGNKLRKLEFLLGEALAQGCDTVITVGARQSNHARLTAAAAARLGLRCELALTRAVPKFEPEYTDNGNVLLDDLLGARVHDLPGDANAQAFAEARASDLRQQGRNPYVIPVGGSTPIGCLGYADCAREIAGQARAMGILFDEIILPNGSGGTHAGLVAGFAVMDDPTPILAFTIAAPPDAARAATLDKASQTARLIQPAAQVAEGAVRVDGSQIGAGYGIPTDAMRAAVRQLASSEGLVIDPVYGGKAFAGLLGGIADGAWGAGKNVLFVMTGGAPGLFAYRSAF